MATWTNADGLVIQLGNTEATLGKGGTYDDVRGGSTCIEFVVQHTDIPLTTATVIDQMVTLPAGVILETVEIIAETAVTSGGSATIDFGLQRLDRTTELDYNGIVAALAITALNAAGKRVVIQNGSTGAGALFNGTATANAGVFTLNALVAALTAGKLRIKLFFYRP